jgi:hypothetical protein
MTDNQLDPNFLKGYEREAEEWETVRKAQTVVVSNARVMMRLIKKLSSYTIKRAAASG